MLHLYNSLTRKKEKFVPMQAGQVSLYVCGVTVYDFCHLGHARSMVCFDVMVRFMRSQGLTVNYVRNITDIDDKIINRANERGIGIDELTTQFIDSMNQDAKALAILSPDHEPRATDHIDSITNLIQTLMDKGYAYLGENGDVYYQVGKFSDYGKLSGKIVEDLESGARVDVVNEKRSPLDFVLWKQSKPGEPSWPSPWGEGRPGWHIECSAMSKEALGEHFDIHGGGLDLQFPHHENEIAQSEAASGKSFANYWLHVGMLQVDGEKMSKSLGNFFTIHDVLKKHNPEVVRYFLLSSHYRSPLNYSEVNLQHAMSSLQRLYQVLKLQLTARSGSIELEQPWIDRFNEAMNDDFNTPEALAVLFQLSREANKENSYSKAATLKHLAGTLGFLQRDPELFLKTGLSAEEEAEINHLITERTVARKKKDFKRSDEIRAVLIERGIELEDGPDGTKWRKIDLNKIN